MIRELARKNSYLRQTYRNYLFRSCLADWKTMLRKESVLWKSKLEETKKGPKILIATAVGSQLHSINIESILSVGLTMRGAEVHTLLCDAALPACFSCIITQCVNLKKSDLIELSSRMCKSCFPRARQIYESIGIPLHLFKDYLTKKDFRTAEMKSRKIPLEGIKEYAMGGVAVGEHTLAGALRFYARGTLDGEPHTHQIVRQYLKSAILTTFVMQRLLEKHTYDCAVFSHGIYVPHGLIGEVCRRRGVRVVNWVPAYRKKTFIFSHNDTYHHTMMNEPIEKWTGLGWNDHLESQIMNYLKSRWNGKQDWIWFSDEASEMGIDRISFATGINFSKPCIGLLTNVVWDAQLHYPENVFSSMLDWIFKTIAYFDRRQDLQLIIRIHPAEIKSALPSRQKVVDEIKRVFPVLPQNVFIIPPESKISTYAVMSRCDSAIIYGTKTGIELANMGIPVIVAGEAWIRNKGITRDARSQEDYFHLLEKLPFGNRLDDEKVRRARKYAYHFFFRRMIPLGLVTPFSKTLFKANLAGLKDLEKGRDAGFDIICDGILNGSDFIYPAEFMSGSDNATASFHR